MPGQAQSRPDGESSTGAQIIAFVPRARADHDPHLPPASVSGNSGTGAPVPVILAPVVRPRDMAAFEHVDSTPDNFRHRMIANGAGFAAALLLALIGIWLAGKMAELRHDQDCVLMRLQSCAAPTPKPLP